MTDLQFDTNTVPPAGEEFICWKLTATAIADGHRYTVVQDIIGDAGPVLTAYATKIVNRYPVDRYSNWVLTAQFEKIPPTLRERRIAATEYARPRPMALACKTCGETSPSRFTTLPRHLNTCDDCA
jgi:hypothetical protein